MEDVLQNPGSYLGIVVILILTGCGLPLPEEIPVITAGVASSVHTLDPWAALISCLIGALVGDSVLYGIGYHFGHNLVKAHPRLAQLLHAEREAQIERLIDKHGLKVLFVARFLIGVRGPLYLTLGILRTPFRKFLLFDSMCATSVVTVFFGLSYLFGDRVSKWIRESEVVFTVIAIGAVVVAVAVYWFRFRAARPILGDVGKLVNPPSPLATGSTSPDTDGNHVATAGNNGEDHPHDGKPAKSSSDSGDAAA